MQFTTATFLIFFAVVFASYAALRNVSARNVWLLLASYVFYGWWDWRFLSLIALSTVVDFVAAQRIHRSSARSSRRRWLLLSCLTNLGALGVFKYYDFFAASLADLASGLGWTLDVATLNVVLPVGISFYTFQTMSYTIDVYRKGLEPERNLLVFAVFVAFFPQLVAGPIERGERMIPQFRTLRPITGEGLVRGISFCLIGLFTKLVLADNAAAIANQAFAAAPPNLGNSLVGTYAFAVQIYGDFSGYSSIAIGLALILGYRLSDNFRQPYLAISVRDFWRRWHISLSSWLRDYLYISLGGNRYGRTRTYRNLMITMILGGLWHGAAWTFVIWGLLHGGYLAIERALGSRIPEARGSVGRVVRGVVVFHLVCLAWIFFRAESLEQGVRMLAGLGNPGLAAPMALVTLPILAGCTLLLDRWRESTGEAAPITRLGPAGVGLAWAMLILGLIVFSGEPQTFIYFQF